MARRAEYERLVMEDQRLQTDKQVRQERLNAEARRRLFCDVSAVQQQQRLEKGTCRRLASVRYDTIRDAVLTCARKPM